MKKLITILETLLIAMVILISGSAVATWVYVTVHSYEDCTNIYEIEHGENGDDATLGVNPTTLGWVKVDLGGNVMGPSQDFTVFADSAESEEYSVSVQDPEKNTPVSVGSNYDTADHDFTTPSTPLKTWRYIILVGESGSVSFEDPIYGPDIDAVGWDTP